MHCFLAFEQLSVTLGRCGSEIGSRQPCSSLLSKVAAECSLLQLPESLFVATREDSKCRWQRKKRRACICIRWRARTTIVMAPRRETGAICEGRLRFRWRCDLSSAAMLDRCGSFRSSRSGYLQMSRSGRAVHFFRHSRKQGGPDLSPSLCNPKCTSRSGRCYDIESR